MRSVALGKIGKNIFPGWKKIVLLGKIFFLVGKIIFSIFPHEKIGKLKKYSATIIVLTFHCLNNLQARIFFISPIRIPEWTLRF